MELWTLSDLDEKMSFDPEEFEKGFRKICDTLSDQELQILMSWVEVFDDNVVDNINEINVGMANAVCKAYSERLKSAYDAMNEIRKEIEMDEFKRSITLGWNTNTRLTCVISPTPLQENIPQNMELTISGRLDTDSYTTMHLPGMDTKQIDKIIGMLLEVKEYLETTNKLNEINKKGD